MADVTVRRVREPAIEAIAETAEHVALAAARTEQQRRQCRAERECVERGDSTEIAMVSANCWYRRPVMPPMNATGMNTAARIRAIAITGPWTCLIAASVASRGDLPVFDVMLHGFDNDDRVIDDETDCEHQAEQRQRVHREAEQREQRERADERHRHREQRDQRRAPALQEHEHHQHDESDRFQQRYDDSGECRGVHRPRRIERDL